MYIFILGICLVLLVIYLSLKLVEKKTNKYRRRIINDIPENKQAVVGDTAAEVIKRERVFIVTKRIICYAFLVFMAFCMIIPFYWMIASSLKSSFEVIQTLPTMVPE